MTLAKAFDRRIINVRERPLSSDPNGDSSNLDYTIREVLMRSLGFRGSITTNNNGTSGVPSGFVADGFKVDAGAGMSIALRAGLGVQDGTGDQPTNINAANDLNDTHAMKPLVLSAVESITVPNADPTNPRWDIVEVKYDRQVLNPSSRDILNTGSGVFTPAIVDKDLVFDLAALSTVNGSGPINYKTGTPAGSPAVPATDAGYIRIGRVYVPAAVGAITSDLIVDDRRLLLPAGIVRVSGGCDVDQGTFAMTNAWVDGPPGVDVLMISTATPQFQVQVLGPFPGITSSIPPCAKFHFDPNNQSAPNGPVAMRDLVLTAGPMHLQTGGTARFPANVLNGGNVNVNYNAVEASALYGCWNGATWTTTGLASVRVSFTIDIPIV